MCSAGSIELRQWRSIRLNTGRNRAAMTPTLRYPRSPALTINMRVEAGYGTSAGMPPAPYLDACNE